MATIDWNEINKFINPDNRVVPYEQSRHLFTKVAFDVFRLNNTPTESLWTLELGEDGKQYLVAMYDDNNELQATSSDWNALIDKEAKNITLFYKNCPIQRFAGKEFGFNTEDAHIFKSTLVNKLSADKDFRNKFITSLSENKRKELFGQFPELA